MTSTETPSLETLLAHERFVRDLARTLVRDAARADDLAQDAWLEVLAKRPGPLHSPKAWLAAVLRHLAWRSALGESRRSRRERGAAVPEALPSASDIVEREALRQEVVQTVLALEEPYRSTIFLRFFEGLPPRETARRFGVPVATVRTRTSRALDQLRRRLDERHGGDRRVWVLAFIRLAIPSSSGPAGAGVLPGFAIKSGAKVGLVAASLAGGVLVWQVAFSRVDEAPPTLLASGGAHPPTLGTPSPQAPDPPEPPWGDRDSPGVSTAAHGARVRGSPGGDGRHGDGGR
ncbi:MAG TPA: RNA polymerase sigma factor [Planctomycetota bacterium]|jgi:RNA polymerase sigma-70 factor (ECF subfamily)|nr:RNA polymerase sigma factor [Planctomycetota bacterium]